MLFIHVVVTNYNISDFINNTSNTDFPSSAEQYACFRPYLFDYHGTGGGSLECLIYFEKHSFLILFRLYYVLLVSVNIFNIWG